MKSLEFLQYDFLYIALFFQVNTTFSAFKRVWLIFIVGKLWLSGIFRSKLFWKKEELKLKRMKIKNLNFLCKIATDCKFWSQQRQSFLIMKMYFSFWFIKISVDMRESFKAFTVFKNQGFLERYRGWYLSMVI